MTARIVTPIPVGASLVSYGWQMGIEGRKAYAGTAIADARGRTMAYARQVWIALPVALPTAARRWANRLAPRGGRKAKPR
jgi:hypothetical protein